MLAFEFVSWWYGAGWQGIRTQAFKRINAVGEAFSISTLFRTLFLPWRRIVTYAGAGLDAHMHAAIDNAVSRFIGFGIRLIALLAAFLVTLLASTYALISIVLWPCLPLMALGLIIWGLL